MGWRFLSLLLLVFAVPAVATHKDDKDPTSTVSFPTLVQLQQMAHLSGLVYQLRHVPSHGENACGYYRNITQNDNDNNNFECLWYHHERILGTQVLMVRHRIHDDIVVVFAGTDDLRTILEDGDIWIKKFGNENGTSLDLRVHAGFNNAVFTHGIFDQILAKIQEYTSKNANSTTKIWTTGHSLGGANAILTAVALSLHISQEITTVTLGSPQIGAWQDWNEWFVHSMNLSVWRLVLGWDVIPRLPEFFVHGGHTVQLLSSSNTSTKTYYNHVGNATLGYAGVPPGWASTLPRPGRFSNHHVKKYIQYLNDMDWKTSFETGDDNGGMDDDWMPPPPPPSDDIYPPDLWVDR